MDLESLDILHKSKSGSQQFIVEVEKKVNCVMRGRIMYNDGGVTQERDKTIPFPC